MDIQTILKDVTDDKRMKVAVTDIDGILRGKFLHPAKFHSVLEGALVFAMWSSAGIWQTHATTMSV